MIRNPKRSQVTSSVSVPVSTWTAFSPLSLQPKLWLDASDLTTITESSGAVSEWRDKSGNNYAFTQSTGTAQPTTGSTTQNGLNVLAFDGNDGLVSTAAASTWKFLHDGTLHLVGIVAKRNTASLDMNVFGTFSGGTSIGESHRFLATNRWGHRVAGTSGSQVVLNEPSISTVTDPFVFTCISDPSQATAANRSSLWVNGGSEQNLNTATAAVSTANPTYTVHLGSRATGSQFLTGTIAEIVVVSGSNVNTTTRTLLHDYLNRKWVVY
jgi:hypothetical protein